jgi:uncharacterized repeat protein (TIGR01451 family)
MKRSTSVLNLELLLKPGRRLLLAVALLTIGSFLVPVDTAAQDWIVDTVPNLQIALTASQNNGEDDTIQVLADFYDVSSAALTYDPAENYSLTIEGEGANDTTLDGGLSSGILKITNFAYNAPVIIKDISFWRGLNSSSPQESGLSVNTMAAITIESCLFTRNSGGSVFIIVYNGAVATLVNNIFSGNNAGGQTLYVGAQGGHANITNNTFVGNMSYQHSSSAVFFETLNGGEVINIYNNIVWGAYTAEASFIGTTNLGSVVNAFNNIYRDWTLTGGGTVSEGDNIDDDPLFVTMGTWDDKGTPDQSDDVWSGGDYHLQDSSPARDTGLNSAPALPSTDFDGDPRINNLIIDRGAYEYIFSASPPDIRVTDSVGDPNDLTIDFGNVLVGESSSTQTITVTNNGGLPLNIGSVVQPSAPFTMVGDACSNLPLLIGGCNIDVQFSPTAVGSFTDILTIPSDDPDEGSIDVALSGTAVESFANLGIQKTVNDATVNVGDTVTFSITVNNNGPVLDATGVEVTDLLPAGLDFQNASADPAAAYDQLTGIWSIGSLAINSVATLTIDADVLMAADDSFVTNTAEITASDPNTSVGNKASASVGVGGADLTVTISGPEELSNDEDDILIVTVTNNGPKSAQDVVLEVSCGPKWSSIYIDSPSCVEDPERHITCQLYTMDSNVSRELNFLMTTDNLSVGNAPYSATVQSSTFDPVNNNSDSGSTFLFTAGIGSGPTCFIATAANESQMEPHVKVWQKFQNHFLLNK